MLLILSILGSIRWAIAIMVVSLLLLIVFFSLLFRPKRLHDRVLPPPVFLYSECELEPGLWAHNDAIASIGIWEELSWEETHYPNVEEAWEIESMEEEEIPGSLGDGKMLSLTTKNRRKWVFKMYLPDNWTWLIKLPLIRFLNDPEYREKVESKVNEKGCDSNIELMIACCLLHSPQYHTSVPEEGKTQGQRDSDQAEKLLLSSSQKGNLNAKYELICLYYEKKEYEKVVELNNAIRLAIGRGVWFVDRIEQSHYHPEKGS